MQFGVFDHMDRGAAPLDRFYAERLRLVEAYDRAGFYGYHVAEHHSTPLGVAPCPGIWLSAVAEHTEQLRFGPLVYLLPLYHPIKLLEEICMLDQISQGRFLLGVGRGISPIELRYYGIDPAIAPAMYAEALEVILRGMTHKELSFKGTYYNYDKVPMELTPYQQPHPPLWYGIGRPDGVPWAAQHRVNVVANLGGSAMRAITDRYRAEWAALGHPAEDMPLMGASRHIVIAETRKEALEIAKRGYHKWRESFLVLWRKHNMELPNPNALFPEQFEEAEGQGRAVAGTADHVREFLQTSIDEGGLNYLLCRFAFGDITCDEALQSVRLFAEQVKPAIRDHTAVRPDVDLQTSA
ncbi:MAG TPA: LLM class flavin-dependent oxidoreductase [Acetobacteraceae bacterium]|jgi:alkanesulfonate monooxygenase SsuD/methylene tetrahydromethanopterin reductase-like flavin-dependent oxidoreductase (luciferase family)|nr:LLM class flavin-dependent oxidoreductase [Acetobacteraceae bacterium]